MCEWAGAPTLGNPSCVSCSPTLLTGRVMASGLSILQVKGLVLSDLSTCVTCSHRSSKSPGLLTCGCRSQVVAPLSWMRLLCWNGSRNAETRTSPSMSGVLGPGRTQEPPGGTDAEGRVQGKGAELLCPLQVCHSSCRCVSTSPAALSTSSLGFLWRPHYI